jgi:uncharacterized protein (TIGR00299 family) protein
MTQRIAIFDPFSGIAGDMALGALIQVGLDADWLRALPGVLGIEGIGVEIQEVVRGEIVCQKVGFDIPPQPHGRHVRDIRRIVAASGAPDRVRALADRTFMAIATAEAEIHGMSVDDVHLHEVGAVDAILDVVGVIWGLETLGVERVHCGPIATGDGSVTAAHGILPVPAPATLKLLEGQVVRGGPENSGELVTPTGAALMRILSSGPAPAEYVPVRSGFGAGTKEFRGRPNALRVVLAHPAVVAGAGDVDEALVELACDIDDMPGEYIAAVGESLREAGALDVTMVPVTMKRGRPGTRIETLCRPGDAARLEDVLLVESTTIGVRRRGVRRRALNRDVIQITVLGEPVTAKVVRLPNGSRRAKPEFVDIQRVALATRRPLQDILRLAIAEAERHSSA